MIITIFGCVYSLQEREGYDHPTDVDDATRKENAEERQIANLKELKKNRNNKNVEVSLKRLEEAARDESVNLMPFLIEAVEAYATLGEICSSLIKVFGTYRGSSL